MRHFQRPLAINQVLLPRVLIRKDPHRKYGTLDHPATCQIPETDLWLI